VETQNGYGFALLKLGRVEEAFPYLRKAAEIGADRAPVHFNLGDALLRSGHSSDAVTEFERTIEHDPTYIPAYSLLGFALLINGRATESVAVLEKGLTLDPHSAPMHLNLANSLLQVGKTKEALAHIETVLADNPMDAEAQKGMAWILSTCPDERLRDGQRAVRLAESASRATEKKEPAVEATLAAAYAEAGRFPEAIETAENALQMASASHATTSLPLIDHELSLFRSGLPLRDNR
jgi:tetratricopeptide (TPR) repeat protein